MSSILDALEKIEATGGPQAPLGSGRDPHRRPPWRVVVMVVTAVVAGAVGAALVLDRRSPGSAPAPQAVAPEPVVVAQVPTTVAPTLPATSTTMATIPPPPPPPPPPVAAPVDATPHAAAPVPAPAPGGGERPWGSDPDGPRAAVPPPVTVPAPAPAAIAPAPARATPPPTLPPAPPPATVTPAAPKVSASLPVGAPRLRISFLVYSSVAERRSVVLTIADQGLVTLREGGESNGVTVVRIHPDRVELRWQDQPFTLEVRS